MPGKIHRSSLGKGWDSLAGQTVPEHREAWSGRFKQRKGRNVHLLLDLWHRRAGLLVLEAA